MTMVLLVVGLHVVAIAIYYAADVDRRPNPVQTGFVVVWTLATLGIVTVYMKRIRQIRDAAIGRRRPARPEGSTARPFSIWVGARHAPRDARELSTQREEYKSGGNCNAKSGTWCDRGCGNIPGGVWRRHEERGYDVRRRARSRSACGGS